MGIIGKVKGKLNIGTDAAKGVEKRAEKLLHGQKPWEVDELGKPDLPATETDPAPRKPVNGTATAGAEPPKPQMVVEGLPPGPGGKQPNLGKLDHVDANPGAAGKAKQKDVKPQSSTGEMGLTGGQSKAAAPGQGSAVAAPDPTPKPPPVPQLPPTPADRVIDAKFIVLGLIALTAFFWLLVIEVLPPRWGEFSFYFLLVGAPTGLGLSFWKHKVKQHKQENIEKLNVYPGLKGLKELLGTVPSWIHYEERERVDWLNSALEQVWPFYDPAVCASVKEAVEPIMDMYKPPGLIKKIYFRRLTFGNAPFKIDNVWVDRSDPEQVCLEMGFRWSGDANIAIAIEPAIAGSTLRMVPKVSDFRVSGTFRIVMRPLVDEIPVVAAMMVALKAPPQVNFNLSLGKAFGGQVVAKPIMLWLDPFLRNTLTDMIVWPNRIVVPLSYDPNFDATALEMRHVGLLKVEAIEADGCKKMDVLGKSDPYLEVFTLAMSKAKTKVAHKTLSPVWNEELHVLVQEPATQLLRIEMYDHDTLNLKELLKVNIIQGAQDIINPGEFMGRCVVDISKFSKHPNTPIDDWYDMGKGEYSNPDGCGRGQGQVHLRVTYTPFDMFERHPADSVSGALLVRLVSAERLAARDTTTSDPFVKFSLNKGRKEQTSFVIQNSLDPVWGQKFEWLNILATETLHVEVYDDDLIGDELLGTLEFDLGHRLRELPPECRDATWHKAFPLDKVAMCEKDHIRPPSKITLKIQWIPYTYTHLEGAAATSVAHKHHHRSKLTSWMHKSDDKKGPLPLSPAEAADGRGATVSDPSVTDSSAGGGKRRFSFSGRRSSVGSSPRASQTASPQGSYTAGATPPPVTPPLTVTTPSGASNGVVHGSSAGSTPSSSRVMDGNAAGMFGGGGGSVPASPVHSTAASGPGGIPRSPTHSSGAAVDSRSGGGGGQAGLRVVEPMLSPEEVARQATSATYMQDPVGAGAQRLEEIRQRIPGGDSQPAVRIEDIRNGVSVANRSTAAPGDAPPTIKAFGSPS